MPAAHIRACVCLIWKVVRYRIDSVMYLYEKISCIRFCFFIFIFCVYGKMFICHALMCTYTLFSITFSFFHSFSHRAHTHPHPFSPSVVPINKYWNNIKLQTYFSNSISLHDETYSHGFSLLLLFFFSRSWMGVFLCWCCRFTKILYWKCLCMVFILFKVHIYVQKQSKTEKKKKIVAFKIFKLYALHSFVF